MERYLIGTLVACALWACGADGASQRSDEPPTADSRAVMRGESVGAEPCGATAADEQSGERTPRHAARRRAINR